MRLELKAVVETIGGRKTQRRISDARGHDRLVQDGLPYEALAAVRTALP